MTSSKRPVSLLCRALAVSFVFAMLFAAPALARDGGYWNYTAGNYDHVAVSGDTAAYPGGVVPAGKVFLRSDADLATVGSSLMEPGDQTPHGGYVDTSAKCKVCHAVHGAGLNVGNNATAPATEKLLRTSAAEACTFCHITTQFATQVYTGDVTKYKRAGTGSRLAGTSGHVDRHQYTDYAGCPSCHSVHGAQIIAGSAILKADPAKGVTSVVPVSYKGKKAGYGSFVEPVSNQRDFCQDCHNGVRRFYADGSHDTIDNQQEFRTVFPSCNSPVCHNSIAADAYNGDGTPGSGDLLTALNNASHVQFGIDASAAKDGRSHVMTPSYEDGSTGTQLAWSATAYAAEGVSADANSCTKCHATSGFPHIATNENLIGGYDSTEHLDGVCASCHTDTGSFTDATKGVGETY